MPRCAFCCAAFPSDGELTRHAGNCIWRKAKIDACVTREYLQSQLSQSISMSEVVRRIQAQFGLAVGVSAMINRARRLGVTTPSSQTANGLPGVRAARAATNLKRYGVENPSADPGCHAKRTATNLQRHGVANVFQSETVKAKARATCLEKYGAEYTSQRLGFRPNCGQLSWPHRVLSQALTTGGIAHENEVRDQFSMFNVELGRAYSPIADIVLRDYYGVIEVYGDSLHANPAKYVASDIICRWRGDKTAAEIWAYDALRCRHIEGCGYFMTAVWASTVMKPRLCKEWIKWLWKQLQSGQFAGYRRRARATI